MLIDLVIKVQVRLKHFNIPDLSDAIQTLTRIRRGINRNRWNSVFSLPVTFVGKSYKNILNWIDAFLAIYFQQGATINRNRFNSVFYFLVNFVIQVLVRLKHFYILGMSDAILPLYLKQGHWNHLNSIFSLLATLALQVRVQVQVQVRLKHFKIPDLSDARHWHD